MKRKKVLTISGIVLFIAIVVIPIHPKHGDRPLMTHREWSPHAVEITALLSTHGDRQRASGSEMVQVNLDQLTGLNGYSLLGVEGLFGLRSTTVVGYVSKEDSEQFFRDEDAVWIDLDSIDKIRKMASEQDVADQRTARGE